MFAGVLTVSVIHGSRGENSGAAAHTQAASPHRRRPLLLAGAVVTAMAIPVPEPVVPLLLSLTRIPVAFAAPPTRA
jgi:hypothetical protein